MAASADFDSSKFLQIIPPMIRKKPVSYGVMDTVNHFVFTTRGELDPSFVIPSSHSSRWHPVDSSSSDSAQSEVDSDEDTLPMQIQNSWIDDLLSHMRAVFDLLDLEHGKKFGAEVADRFGLTVKQRGKLKII